jgi:hypothetical protein
VLRNSLAELSKAVITDRGQAHRRIRELYAAFDETAAALEQRHEAAETPRLGAPRRHFAPNFSLIFFLSRARARVRASPSGWLGELEDAVPLGDRQIEVLALERLCRLTIVPANHRLPGAVPLHHRVPVARVALRGFGKRVVRTLEVAGALQFDTLRITHGGVLRRCLRRRRRLAGGLRVRLGLRTRAGRGRRRGGRGRFSRNPDHLPCVEPARIRDPVVFREDIEAKAVTEELLRDLGQRFVALHGVAKEDRAQFLLGIGLDLINELARKFVAGVERERLVQRRARSGLVAVLQLVHGFDREPLRLGLGLREGKLGNGRRRRRRRRRCHRHRGRRRRHGGRLGRDGRRRRAPCDQRHNRNRHAGGMLRFLARHSLAHVASI